MQTRLRSIPIFDEAELGNLGEEMGIYFVELGTIFAECEVEFERDGRDGGANKGVISGHPIPLCKGLVSGKYLF